MSIQKKRMSESGQDETEGGSPPTTEQHLSHSSLNENNGHGNQEERIHFLESNMDQMKTLMGKFERDAKYWQDKAEQLQVSLDEVNEQNRKMGEREQSGPSGPAKEGGPGAEKGFQGDTVSTDQESPSNEASELRVRIAAMEAVHSRSLNYLQQQNTSLQVALQSARQYLGEIQLHYEEFVRISRLEAEAFQEHELARYNNLVKEFDRFKSLQLVEKRKMLSDQQELLFSLQSQLDDFKSITHRYLTSESTKMEQKLSLQMQYYEEEIKSIIYSKDYLFDEMVAAKDAKILSLIEGTETQNLVQKHRNELEVVNRAFSKKIMQMESNFKHNLQNLKEENAQNETRLKNVIEQERQNTAQAQHQTAELRVLLGQKAEIMLEKEEAHNKIASEWQTQLKTAHETIYTLKQQVDHYKHALIKLRLEIKGIGNDNPVAQYHQMNKSMEHLQRESAKLAQKHAKMESELLSHELQNERLSKAVATLKTQNSTLLDEYSKLTDAYEKLLTTFTAQLNNSTRHLPHEREGERAKKPYMKDTLSTTFARGLLEEVEKQYYQAERETGRKLFKATLFGLSGEPRPKPFLPEVSPSPRGRSAAAADRTPGSSVSHRTFDSDEDMVLEAQRYKQMLSHFRQVSDAYRLNSARLKNAVKLRNPSIRLEGVRPDPGQFLSHEHGTTSPASVDSEDPHWAQQAGVRVIYSGQQQHSSSLSSLRAASADAQTIQPSLPLYETATTAKKGKSPKPGGKVANKKSSQKPAALAHLIHLRKGIHSEPPLPPDLTFSAIAEPNQSDLQVTMVPAPPKSGLGKTASRHTAKPRRVHPPTSTQKTVVPSTPFLAYTVKQT